MSQPTQDQECLVQAKGKVADIVCEYNTADMEESNRGIDHAIMGTFAPNTFAAALSQVVNLDDFDPNKIDYQALNANALAFPGMYGSFQEPDVTQHQPQPYFQHRRNPLVDTQFQDGGLGAFRRILLPNQQVSPQLYGLQVPQCDLRQRHTSPQPVQLSYAQTQSPWLKQESPSYVRRMPDVSPQWFAAHQSRTSHSAAPTPPELQSELRYPVIARSGAPQSCVVAGDKKASEKSSGDKKQKKASATPRVQPRASAKVPIPSPTLIAAAAPKPLRFASFPEAEQAAATRFVPYNYTPPADDNSFPKDQEARKAYIRQMYEAYVDITQCIDRATVPNFDSFFGTLSSNPSTSPITPFEISTICWNLLTIAIDLHIRGPVCLNVYDPAKLKNVYKYRKLEFSERIAKICELLRMSKARCNSLLRLDGLGMVVATAPALCRQTMSNHLHNSRRQTDLVIGKNVVAGKKRGAAAMDGDEDEAEEKESEE